MREGYLALPNSKTGAKRIELSEQAVAILSRTKRVPGNPYVITGTLPGQHWTDLQRPWRRIRKKIELPDLRIHDLRHTFASVAASGGESLLMIGKLLGHTQAQTTARYAHPAPAPLRDTAERVASKIALAMGTGATLSRAANSNVPHPPAAAEGGTVDS